MPSRVVTIVVSDGRQIVPCLDPLTLAEQCEERGNPTSPWFGRCNSVTFGVGPDAGVAELLLPFSILRDMYESLPDVPGTQWEKHQAEFFQLTIGLTDHATNRVRWTTAFNVVDVKAVLGPRQYDDNTACYVKLQRFNLKLGTGFNQPFYTGSIPSPVAPDTLILVEPPTPDVEDYTDTDIGVASGPAFNIPKTSHHAVEFDSDPGVLNKELYEPQTLYDGYDVLVAPGIDSGRPFWTWQQMISVVMGSGGATTDRNELPYEPVGFPIDFDFTMIDQTIGEFAILDRLGLTRVYNQNWRDSVNEAYDLDWTLAEVGGEDEEFDDAIEEMAPALLFDYLPWSYLYGVPRVTARVKNIPVQIWYSDDAAPGAGESAVEAGQTYDAAYYSFSDVPALVGAYVPPLDQPDNYFSRHYGGNQRYALIDHDAVLFSFGVGGKTGLNDDLNPDWFYKSLQENASRYARQFWAEKSMNRVYTGFHCRDEIMPGPSMKLVRFEDVGMGPRTAIYRGERYYPPHCCYYIANPHRHIRRDALNLPSLESIDMSKL